MAGRAIQRIGAATLALIAECIAFSSPGLMAERPPQARRDKDVSVYRISVPEPYRWMEAMQSESVVAWTRSQDQYARGFAAESQFRCEILKRLQLTASHERYLAPLLSGGRYFYARVNSSFTRFTLLVRDGRDGAERVLVDPAAVEREGRVVDRSFWPSLDGGLLAYGVRRQGSRWMEVRFLNARTGAELPDRLSGLQGNQLSQLSWASDGSGVYYDAFEPARTEELLTAPLRASRVAFHRLGTPQEEDVVLIKAARDEEMVLHSATDQGRWIVIRVFEGSRITRIVALEARGAASKPRELIRSAAASTFDLIGSRGNELWMYTTRGAPNGRVIAIPVNDPSPGNWRDIIPEQSEAIDTWMGVDAVGDGLVAGYRRDGLLQIRYFEPGQTRGRVIPLAKIGSVWFGVNGRQGEPEFCYLLSGFADPGTVYCHDLTSGRTEAFLEPELGYDPDDFVTRQVFYEGPNGDRIPMYLAHHRTVKPDGTHPVMIYGYGFLNWSASPWFRAHIPEWLRMGGVFALPAIRGGGEFGREWADAGVRLNRQNAIDDFIAAARWLVAGGLADPARLVAETNSAGASVVGAAIVQRPDLFGAAILGFPLLDVLNYHRFTGGQRWVSQLGTVEHPEEARALVAYSPVHTIVSGRCYPSTFVAPGELDETTPPFHAYKFVAALQSAQSCDRPVLLRISWGAGHADGKDQESTLENFADQLSFLTRVLPADTQWRR